MRKRREILLLHLSLLPHLLHPLLWVRRLDERILLKNGKTRVTSLLLTMGKNHVNPEKKMLKKPLLTFLILPVSLLSWLSVGMFADSKANALPGQKTEEVETWIKAHPTLRPNRGERLFIQKSDTAAQRFTFLASVLPPGKVAFAKDRSMIRNERITMYDAVNGMSSQ